MKTLNELKAKELQYKKIKTKKLVLVERTISEYPDQSKTLSKLKSALDNSLHYLGYLGMDKSAIQLQKQISDFMDAKGL